MSEQGMFEFTAIRNDALIAADRWRELAESERRMKVIDSQYGDTSSHDARIDLYERTAASLGVKSS